MGDIYKVDAKGGEAIRLTSRTAYDYNAIWSPDGKTVAFASDRNGNFDIYTMSAEGGTPTRITTNSTKEIPSSFTPDGKAILFSAVLADSYKNAMFPKGYLSELYSAPVTGGRETQVLTTPAEDAHYNKAMTQIIYTDKKAGENAWRKHHTSSVTRDIRVFDLASGKHSFLSSFKGEDRQPIINSDETSIFYLSEKSGSFNIWKMDSEMGTNKTQITKYEDNPVRFLSASDNNILCYGYRGEIYTQSETGQAEKLNVKIRIDHTAYKNTFLSKSSGATEMSVSPDGKEIAFIVRGEVFVTSVDYQTTKQITNTPEQERSVSFSPDGKSLIYASERNGSWNLYCTKIKNKNEINFTHSTILIEDEILSNSNETFRPVFSPDGKEIAYLANRTELQVINLKSKNIRTILEGKWNYSYTDNDFILSGRLTANGF